jgi:hypothetical protein
MPSLALTCDTTAAAVAASAALLLQAFDGALRGLGVDDVIELEVRGMLCCAVLCGTQGLRHRNRMELQQGQQFPTQAAGIWVWAGPEGPRKNTLRSLTQPPQQQQQTGLVWSQSQ